MKTFSDHPTYSGRIRGIQAQFFKSRKQVLKGNNPEALHDFRVSIRRLRTCLRLLKDAYPRPLLKPILFALRRIAHDTNALRDQEVFCAIWESLPPAKKPSPGLRKWLQTQNKVKRSREREVRRILASPHFDRWTRGLPGKLALGGEDKNVTGEVKRRFRKEYLKLGKILRKCGSSKAEIPLLHRFRVEAKRVRYALEEFGFLMPRRGGKLAAKCKKVQDRLGEWRDIHRVLRILKKSGTGRFPEIKSWIRELKAREKTSWKRYRKTLGALQKQF